MIDPTNSITTETLNVVEKIREERWAQAQNLYGVLGDHISRAYINMHTARALAEKLHEVEELDTALMVLRAVWNEPKTPRGQSATASSGFAINDQIVQIAADDITFSSGTILTVIDAGDRFWMHVRDPNGVKHWVRPSAYGKAPR